MRIKHGWVALLLFGFAYASATVAEARWPSLGGGFARTGQSPDLGPLSGNVRWRFETGAPVTGSVTVGSAGHIHIACEDGKLYTLGSEGKVQWILDANSPLLSAPSIGPDGSLYVGGKSGKVYAVASDGRLRWSFATGGAVYSSPAVGAGDVYVGSSDGTLYALAASDGVELWRFKTQGPGVLPNGAIFASPSICPDGTVYIGGLYDPTLYALNPADGGVKWSCRFPDTSKDPNTGGWPFASPVVAADGTIYQTLLYDRHLYAIEPADGAIRWSVELPDLGIPVTPNLTIPADGDGWSEPVLGPDGTIYVSLDDRYIHAVAPKGTIKWSKSFGQVGGFTLVVDKTSTIYAASDDGFLYVVGSDGTELARFETGGWPAYPVIAADNLLILADSKDYSSLEKGAKNTVWAIGAPAVEQRN
ncbi:MAG TPA: PQQ-binding-like beta-propeller repeat protein [Sedimentisphaerales bacterium]|nr:PQQ-binding-like beta-propeller repeat protein [Sedimentisphaerales bacterium]